MKIEKTIRKILKETLDKELVNFANRYIDNNSCDIIYQDLSKFQTAVNGGKIQISDNDKTELDKNLIRFKNEVVDASFLKQGKCNFAKGEMKKEFEKQSRENSEYLKTTMCWFAENIIKGEKLNICQASSVTEPPVSTPQGSPTAKPPTPTPSLPSGNQEVKPKKPFDPETWEF